MIGTKLIRLERLAENVHFRRLYSRQCTELIQEEHDSVGQLAAHFIGNGKHFSV